MKIFCLLFLYVLTLESTAQVYISEESSGHNMTYLIISEDSVIIESYHLQMKLTPVLFTKKINVYQKIDASESIIKTNKFVIIQKSEDTLCVENVNYFSHYKLDKCGDFARLDSSFCNLNTLEKLNICRNCYFLLHPPNEIKERLQKYPLKGLKVTEHINCRQDNSVFLKNLLILIPQ